MIWKLKVPLKIKIFMRYMFREVVLTKDNLIRRNWKGGKQCSFCLKEESIKHLLYECHYARFLWGLSHITFNVPPPRNVKHMLNTWINQFRVN
jgi:hypothetical protein